MFYLEAIKFFRYIKQASKNVRALRSGAITFFDAPSKQSGCYEMLAVFMRGRLLPTCEIFA